MTFHVIDTKTGKVLADDCGNITYCDMERFKVVAESEDIDPNDMTHMFDGVTEIPQDAFKGWTTEEMLKQIRSGK